MHIAVISTEVSLELNYRHQAEANSRLHLHRSSDSVI